MEDKATKAASAIRSLGYVRIGVKDPGAWLKVGQDILGFQPAAGENGALGLRMDQAPFRLLIEPAPVDRFICAGWECARDSFNSIVGGLADHRVALHRGNAQECAARGVAAFVAADDPSGNHFEIFHSRHSTAAAFEPKVAGVEYKADALGLGHAVLPASAHAETSRFYQKHLGFRMSDELTLPPPAEGAPELCIHFLHATSPRHHSLGLFNGPAPSGLVHLMVEMTSLDAVGSCLDRVLAADLPVIASLGRHANDGMVSFYFLAPGGIPMEVGYDGLLFDWSEFVPTKSTVAEIWGHAYSFPEPTP